MFDRSKDPPWYLLPLLPVVFAVGLVLILTVAILSIPYGFLFPHRRRHFYDIDATPHQKELLARGVQNMRA